MDKFGYVKGRRGPPGPKGKDAIELHTWCPDAVLRMFRESESCTFYFNTAEDGILKNEKGIMALKDRFGKNNAICLKKILKPIKVGRFYGIPLKDTLYKISDIQTATVPPSICYIAFAFRVTSQLSNENDYIFTNETGTRGVTISEKSLNFLGTDPLDLHYNYKGWNTLVVQYSNITDNNDGKCFFVLNGRQGFFLPHKNIEAIAKEVYIGGNFKGKNHASVLLVNFDLYWKIFDEPLTSSYLVPQEITQLINADMLDRLEKEKK